MSLCLSRMEWFRAVSKVHRDAAHETGLCALIFVPPFSTSHAHVEAREKYVRHLARMCWLGKCIAPSQSSADSRIQSSRGPRREARALVNVSALIDWFAWADCFCADRLVRLDELSCLRIKNVLLAYWSTCFNRCLHGPRPFING